MSRSTKTKTIQLLKVLKDLPPLFGQYDYECVYNMDKTGLFFRVVSRYTVLMIHENVTTVRSKKQTKDKVTLMFYSNASWTKQILITMIGKAKQHAWIVKNTWSIPYFHQKNAWIDVSTFNKWFDEIFEPYVFWRTRHKVLLLLGNIPDHAIAFERNGICVNFFLSNVNFWKQQMNMTIIVYWYKYLLLNDIVTCYINLEILRDQVALTALKLKRSATRVAYRRSLHLLDAANFANAAWNDIAIALLKIWFKKAKLFLDLAGPIIPITRWCHYLWHY